MNSVFNWINSLVNKIAKNYTLWIAAGLLILAAIGLKAYSFVFPPLLEPSVYSGYMLTQTDWTSDRRERYYQTSQGSLVVPYAWYMSLESRTSEQLWASPEIQVKFGLLPDNNPKYNPDRLPIGIVKNIIEDKYVKSLGLGHQEWASLSCAACHTGQLLYKGTALRIDGGNGLWRFEQWSADLVFSLFLTSSSPPKFERFCARVNGHWPNGTCSDNEKETLRAEMKAYFDSDLIMDAINAILNHTYLIQEGFTRTDALGRGVNGVFGPLDRRNIVPSNGPVSYPPLWYTHDFDWVQSPAAIRQPLGRNVTEAWGVNMRVDLNDPANNKELFGSTARMENLFWMEALLGTLHAPKWPENVLGQIDRERAERGRRLYNEAVWDKALPAAQAELPENKDEFIKGPNPNRPTTGYCARCHAAAWDPQPDSYGNKYIQLPLYRMEVMGTDPDDAMKFRARQIHTGALQPKFGKETVGIGTALTVNVTAVLDKWFKDHNVDEPCQVIMEGDRPNLFRAPPAYPARPLDGYWATGPFLHNGSVRTLYQLLSPVQERDKYFWIGTWEFDPHHVGFRDEQVEGSFLLDTTLAGNSNAGHEFRDAPPNTPGVIGPLLTRDQRLDIIEYMKIMDEVHPPQEAHAKRNAMLDASAPYYENSGSAAYGSSEKGGGIDMTNYCKAIVAAANVPHSEAPKKK